jgi:transcriptional regulator with XRE-family HTH domain
MNQEEREQRGQAIYDRLEAIRMSHRAFCDRSGVARRTLARAIEGNESVRPNSFGLIEDWLDKFEAEYAERVRGGDDERDDEPRIEVTLSIRESDLRRVLDILDLGFGR